LTSKLPSNIWTKCIKIRALGYILVFTVFLCTMCILNCHHIHVLSSPSKIEMAYTFKGKTLFGKLMQCQWHTLPVALPSGPRSAIRSLWPCGERHQGKSGKISYSMLCQSLSYSAQFSQNFATACCETILQTVW
jgi:hypothetical protein